MDERVLHREMDQERRTIEKSLGRLLRQEKGIPTRLKAAMKHSLLGGGKRLRPILLLWAYDAISERSKTPVVSRELALEAACALEMLHTYSLIHDDLPAMDDDVLRRGRPTCHVAFDEATAILAGDALQALAFTILARSGGQVAGALVEILGHAVGPAGMVGGQQLDLDSEGLDVDAGLVRRIHLGKTAALLAASMGAGALLANAPVDVCHQLHAAGMNLGLAFQGADDVLDVTATSEQLGKSVGKDQAVGKATWVRIEGVEKARGRASKYGRKGMEILADHIPSGPAGDKLLGVSALMWNRTH
jgi:geranylgeranyl diphosphate synthase, type II